jgi:5-methylcytosine-specific restriction endonuclease McrA
MGRLQTLKPQVRMIQNNVRQMRAGDVRIRGWALTLIRERILRRDSGVCQCGECKATGRVRLASIVDHIVPLWAGGREADSNRQAINEECHERKSAAEAAMRAAGAYVPACR